MTKKINASLEQAIKASSMWTRPLNLYDWMSEKRRLAIVSEALRLKESCSQTPSYYSMRAAECENPDDYWLTSSISYQGEPRPVILSTKSSTQMVA